MKRVEEFPSMMLGRHRRIISLPKNLIKKNLQEAQICLFFDLTQLERVPYKGIIENQEIMEGRSLRDAVPSGNRDASTHND